MAKDSPDPLAGARLFGGLGEKDRKRLAGAMTSRDVAAGETLISEGNGGVAFFSILEGEAAVVVGDREIRRLGPGDFCGELAVLDGGSRTASVVAKTDVKTLALTPWSFKAVVTGNGPLAWELLTTLAAKLREAEARNAEL